MGTKFWKGEGMEYKVPAVWSSLGHNVTFILTENQKKVQFRDEWLAVER